MTATADQIPAHRPVPPPPPAAWAPHTIVAQERRMEKNGKGVDVERFVDVEVRVMRRVGPPHPLVPPIDPAYVFRAELLRELSWAIWPHDGGPWTPALLTGPQGSGKTTLVLQLAARCNAPVYRTNLNVGTTVAHLKGRKGAEAGRTTFVPGVATMALEEGSWLLCDELAGATPPVALSLFPIFEPTGAVMLEDEQPPRFVRRHPDFRAFASDNTIGADQESTRFDFAGTNPEVSQALLDRFGCTLHVPWMSREQEWNLVRAKVPAIGEDLAEGMVRVAHNCRTAGTSFSTRMMLDWARRVAAGKLAPDGSVADANQQAWMVECAHPAFLSRMRSPADREAVLEVMRRVFGIKG